MRAAIFRENGGPEVISVEDVDPPVPGPGEVRIQVEAASLNHLDLWVRRGLPIETPMPHIGGSDIVGRVESVGSDALAGWMGKRVVVDPSLSYDWYELAGRKDGLVSSFGVIGEHTQGGFAEMVVVPGANLLEVPEGVSSETAAAGALAGVTAWRGLMVRGRLRPGE
ncbi:MAG: alcohol dehydrogenase catalytic domain-containing protein, partial [Gemmatimonadota bacterium]|nr:alcohol dehydrogenase catalytic domain-containing protein [Gemmatimonadota bacterium]